MRAWKLVATVIAVATTLGLALQEPIVDQFGAALNTLDLTTIILIIFLFGLMRTFQALALQISLNESQSRLEFQSAVGLIALKGFYNLAFSGAGLVAVALRGRAALNIQIKDLAAATLLQAALLIIVLGLLFAVASLCFEPDPRYKIAFALLGLSVAAIPFLIGTLTRFASRRVIQRLPRAVQRAAEYGRDSAIWSTRTKVVATLIIFAYVTSRLARIIVLALIIDSSANVGHLIYVVVGADLLSIIPITPSGIGVREIAIGAGGAFIGEFDLFLSAAVLDRMVSIGLNLIHGLTVIFWQMLDRQRHPGLR